MFKKPSWPKSAFSYYSIPWWKRNTGLLLYLAIVALSVAGIIYNFI